MPCNFSHSGCIFFKNYSAVCYFLKCILFIFPFRYCLLPSFQILAFLKSSVLSPLSVVIFFTWPLGDFIYCMYLVIIHTLITHNLTLQSRCVFFVLDLCVLLPNEFLVVCLQTSQTYCHVELILCPCSCQTSSSSRFHSLSRSNSIYPDARMRN